MTLISLHGASAVCRICMNKHCNCSFAGTVDWVLWTGYYGQGTVDWVLWTGYCGLVGQEFSIDLK